MEVYHSDIPLPENMRPDWERFIGSPVQRWLHNKLATDQQAILGQFLRADAEKLPLFREQLKVLNEILQFLHQHDTEPIKRDLYRITGT